MIQYFKQVGMEINTILGIRNVPLCSTCKYYIKKENACGKMYKFDYVTGEYKIPNIEYARKPFWCGHVGYYYEKKGNDHPPRDSEIIN